MSNQKSKRDLVLGLLDSDNPDSYIPAGFFTHFDPEYHTGQAAVDKHLEFVEYTGMDIVKIQYEAQFPAHPEIQHPEDWSKMPVHGIDYYAEALKVIEGLVNAASKDALVIVTLYSPFMLAGRAVGNERILEGRRRLAPDLDSVTASTPAPDSVVAAPGSQISYYGHPWAPIIDSA